ncbi:MAG: hypothetical protein CL769_01580 [Chloroflexi bacterium]|nr:hypothetical protein [Chloroflexota bacterium]|tara:strand:- start:1159 stop:2184 length:1026 start_codon:yes stop_codon:yes gene_type:complete
MMNFILENKKGLFLCLSISLISYVIQYFEILIFDSKIFDVLIISLLIGIIVKNIPNKIPKFFSREDKAPKFVSKNLLEFAVILLGFNINFSIIKESGISLITISIISVLAGMSLIFLLCKFILKLDKSVSILVATGNSICGNSAIAAMASVIKSPSSHVASAISFSATIGLLQVIFLPILFAIISITEFQYGIIAGLSVYAVPQVVAASFVIGNEAGLIATQVKLLRVLMLGPLIIIVGFFSNKSNENIFSKNKIGTYIPWFVIGFIVASIIGTSGVIPENLIKNINSLSKILFSISMAGIGLTVAFEDLKVSAVKISIAVLLSSLLMITFAIIGISIFNL